jgi:60 kDa SS-A/Ro ribonucleoprotein
MARTLDLLTARGNPYAQAARMNPEGFPSFDRPWQERYLQVLLTNTLTGTFYAESRGLLKNAFQLHQQAARLDPAFMARALVYGREEGLMRIQPIVGLAVLSKQERGLFHQIFPRIIQTPGDLADFMEITRGGLLPGKIGRSIKRVVNAWLNGMSEYHALKYASGGQGYALRDVLRLCHPKPKDAAQDTRFMWLVDREKWLAAPPETQAQTPQIAAFEALKQAPSAEQARELITAGRLPQEIVTGVAKMDAATWRTLIPQMPYMALLRHLNTLQKAGVLADEATAQEVATRLSQPEAVARSKQLPFRFYNAYQLFQPQAPAENLIREALTLALELSFQHMPDLPGRICIAPDVSGSMNGQISAKSHTRFIDIAGIFAAALYKKSPQARIMPFDTYVHAPGFNRGDSLMSIAAQLATYGGGGTALSAPISNLLAQNLAVEVFIGITDNIEWAQDNYGNHGFLTTWRQYKQQVAPQAKAFLLTIAPYQHAVAPDTEPDVFYLYGWNEGVLKFITWTLGDKAGQVAAVQAISL